MFPLVIDINLPQISQSTGNIYFIDHVDSDLVFCLLRVKCRLYGFVDWSVSMYTLTNDDWKVTFGIHSIIIKVVKYYIK